MTSAPIRVGFIGLNPDTHWAAAAHLPALKALSNEFDVVGVANSTPESSKRTAEALGLRHAFDSVDALVRSPDIDLVVVTVKVPHHLTLVTQALNAGKHVHCEWPLGNGLAEAEALADLAQAKGVVATVGTQARLAPEVLYLAQLIRDGYVGEVLSTSIVASGANWADRTSAELAYLYDRGTGATMLTIPMGHLLAALCDVLGEVRDVKASLQIRRPLVTIEETGQAFARSAADQIMVCGQLQSGAALSLHYRGGISRGTNLLWEINGSEGDLQVTGAHGHAQMVQLSIRGARGDQRELQPLAPPDDAYAGLPANLPARNVAAIYARVAHDIRHGTRTAPSFHDAVALHRLLDQIVQAAQRS
jgi:predicted dehydrogenase